MPINHFPNSNQNNKEDEKKWMEKEKMGSRSEEVKKKENIYSMNIYIKKDSIIERKILK